MGSSVMVPVEEYLRTNYEHDREWVDGVVKERGMPDGYHGYFEDWFLDYFRKFRVEFNLRGLSEVRFPMSPRSWRVPDVMVIRADAPFLPLPTETPLVCIEMLSPDERDDDLQEKIADYVARGVKGVWIVDPRRRTMWTADADGTHRVREFLLEGTEVRITEEALFGDLDKLEALSG